jgi:hypothetical protein
MKRLLTRLGAFEDLQGWLRAIAVALVAAAFLTLAGAFGTYEVPLGPRAVYWFTLMIAGTVVGSLVARAFFSEQRRRRWPAWLRVIAASLAMSVPFSFMVWAGGRYILGSEMPLVAAPLLFFSVLAVSLVLTAINTLIETRRVVVTHATPAAPKFLERLPLKLRGAEVWAVEAEDHYLRLHTSKGQDLILLRLADAVAELEGIEGAQVHRSWWVARDAITDARRGDGRATLTLKDGAEVPVSRTYARELREKGWI